MIIRQMMTSDINDVQIMMRDLQNSHAEKAPEIFKMDVLREPAYFEKLLSEKSRIIFVAEGSDGSPVGFVKGKIVDFPGTTTLHARKYGYVDGIFVKKEYRGQLVEYKLQKHLFNWFSMQGLKHVEANVWDFNERAREYYQLFGYSYVKHGLQIDL